MIYQNILTVFKLKVDNERLIYGYATPYTYDLLYLFKPTVFTEFEEIEAFKELTVQKVFIK